LFKVVAGSVGVGAASGEDAMLQLLQWKNVRMPLDAAAV
jgi:hypothetical protein